MTEQELVDLKRRIDTSKQKQSELKGKKKALLETLQTTFSCKTIEQAEKKALELQDEIEEIEKEKQKKIKEIEDNYEF